MRRAARVPRIDTDSFPVPATPTLLVQVTAQQLREAYRNDPGAFAASLDRLIGQCGSDTETGRFWLAVKQFAARSSKQRPESKKGA